MCENLCVCVCGRLNTFKNNGTKQTPEKKGCKEEIEL